MALLALRELFGIFSVLLFPLAHLEMRTFLIEMHFQLHINYTLVAHLLETVLLCYHSKLHPDACDLKLMIT